MWDAEDDENDGHDGERHHENEIGAVETPKSGAAEEWSIFVGDFDEPPTSNSELISTHEAEQACDDGEINT